jgi:hypothetical protein
MENLIELSHQKSQTSFYKLENGELINQYKINVAKIPHDGEETIYYTFQRSILNDVRSYIHTEKIYGAYLHNKKSYWKFYEDDVKFENALKRIQKLNPIILR